MAVGTPAVAPLILKKGIIIEFAVRHRAAQTVERVEQAERTAGLARGELDGLSPGALLHDKIDQSPKLRTILQTGGTPDDFYFTEGFGRGGVIAFGVPQGVGADVVAILPDIEIGGAVGAESPAPDAQLQSAPVIFPYVQAGNTGVNLPGVVGGQIRIQVSDVDQFGFLAGINRRTRYIAEPSGNGFGILPHHQYLLGKHVDRCFEPDVQPHALLRK